MHVHALETELQQLGRQFTNELRSEGLIIPSEDTVAEAIAAKEYLLFGPAHGKLSLFVRTQPARGEALYRMYTLFYERTGEMWKEVESGICMDGESMLLAQEAFQDAV